MAQQKLNLSPFILFYDLIKYAGGINYKIGKSLHEFFRTAPLRIILTPEEDYTLSELRQAPSVPKRTSDSAHMLRLNCNDRRTNIKNYKSRKSRTINPVVFAQVAESLDNSSQYLTKLIKVVSRWLMLSNRRCAVDSCLAPWRNINSNSNNRSSLLISV